MSPVPVTAKDMDSRVAVFVPALVSVMLKRVTPSVPGT